MSQAESIDQAVYSLELYEWVVFTSVNGVEMFWQRLAENQNLENGRAQDGQPQSLAAKMPKTAAIGPITAHALLDKGIQPAFTPDSFVGEAVAEGLGELQGKRVLLLRAETAREALPKLLEARGAIVDDLPVYRTVPEKPDPKALPELQAGVDAITFTSSSTVRNWVDSVDELHPSPLIVCIGPVTADTAKALGLRPDIIANEFTTDGLVDALVAHYSKEGQP